MKFNDKETNKDNEYIQITKKDLPKIFEIAENRVYLRNSKAFPFKLSFPLDLNEDIAKIAAMILDGSISKDLNGCMFSQKKDATKPIEFLSIIMKKFGIKGKLSIDKKTDTKILSYPRRTFVSFLYHCLDIHKSDEEAKIPYWIWGSPKSVIIEYLRYAYAMEGSISHYLKGSEIRFHSVDLRYLKDLKRLLKGKFNIGSNIQKYFIKGYGWKYYLMFSKKEEIFRFAEIGFAIKSHQERLNGLITYLKISKPKTNPRINEEKILEFLNCRGRSYRNEISRELKIDNATVRDTLIRLIKKGEIEYIISDKFQRKFYRVKKNQ